MKMLDYDGFINAGGVRRDDLFIKHPMTFLDHIPDYVQRLKFRIPTRIWELNYSINSVEIIDDYIGNYLDALLAAKKDVYQHLNSDLVLEVVAYIGEVIRRNYNAKWEIAESNSVPILLLAILVKRNSNNYAKRIDVYKHILQVIVEGGSLAEWLINEIQ